MYCSGCGNAVVAGPGGECVECARAGPAPMSRGEPQAGRAAAIRRRVLGWATMGAGVLVAGVGVAVLVSLGSALAQEALR